MVLVPYRLWKRYGDAEILRAAFGPLIGQVFPPIAPPVIDNSDDGDGFDPEADACRREAERDNREDR